MTLHKHEFGLWKPKKASKLKQKMRDKGEKKKARPGNSEKHLAAIRTLPCVIPGCTVVGCDPHHLKSGQAASERGVAMKASDRWTVPLCRVHHNEVERISSRGELGWFEKHGLEPLELAAALWMVSPDKGAMFRVVMAHKSQEAKGK